MEKRLLLIGDKKSFMVNSIAKELTQEGFEVIMSAPDVTQIERIENKPEIFLIYVDNLEDMAEFSVYMKDKLVESDISVSVIGSHDEIEKIYSMTDKEKIAAAFERPVNVKQLAAQMHSVVENECVKLRKKKILVVDDDGTMLRTIKSWLSSRYQVYMVNSGMAAIAFLAKNMVDLILLDYEMPVTPGPKVLEMLRSESFTKDIPVMFLTVKSDKDSVMQVLALKPEKYLLKTMPPAELVANIDDFFNQQNQKHMDT